eukprot:TRINITY_DN108922_c0_g1_i1.p1 TRINITY_DN108922_c0_g1~~TRINITY_DN108922_c0_g1_i1.p1  ORF type:complete len:258 (+),score=91.74 TRINITY_DN108922_c0_g1_i1:65-838(+)
MASNGRDWTKYLLAAGGAVGALGVLYYLLREGEEEESPGPKISKEGGSVQQLLTEMVHVEDLAKKTVQDITKEQVEGKGLTMEEAYDRMAKTELWDPLEKYGLSVEDFDKMIQEFQHDPFVIQAIAKLSGQDPSSPPDIKKELTVDEVIEAKKCAQEELEALVAEFLAKPGIEKRSARTAGMALQALVNAKVQKKTGFRSEDVEGSIMANQMVLQSSEQFIDCFMKTQMTMNKLMQTISMAQVGNKGGAAKAGGDVD